jgi:hypothetical protein
MQRGPVPRYLREYIANAEENVFRIISELLQLSKVERENSSENGGADPVNRCLQRKCGVMRGKTTLEFLLQ